MKPEPPSPKALLEEARAGGVWAGLAARRAALLAERSDPALAREALALAARLEPLDPAPRLDLARLHAQNGDIDAARAEAEAVLKDSVDKAARARAAFMLGEIARIAGPHAAARGHYETVLAIEQALLNADRADPAAARWYARARGRTAELDAQEGRLAQARTGAEGALAMLRAVAAQIGETPLLAADIADAEMRLGALELDTGDAPNARRRLGEAIARYEALAVTEKDEPHWRAVLSDAWALAAEADYARGAAEDARAAMDRSLQARLKLAADHAEEAWALAGTWRLHAALFAALGDAETAAASLTQARALAERLHRATGGDAQARFLVHTLLDQADHALRAQDLSLARDAADAARSLAESAAREQGSGAHWFGEAGACWDRLGELARAARSIAKAQDAFARAVEFRRLAHDATPGGARAKRGLAAALVKLGDCALEAGAPHTAQAAFSESSSIRARMTEAAPNDAHAAQALAVALERLGLAAKASGEIGAAHDAWEEELALAGRIYGDDDNLDGMRFRAIVESHLAGLASPDADAHRQNALARFDVLARAGVLSEREAALRKKLWGG